MWHLRQPIGMHSDYFRISATGLVNFVVASHPSRPKICNKCRNFSQPVIAVSIFNRHIPIDSLVRKCELTDEGRAIWGNEGRESCRETRRALRRRFHDATSLIKRSACNGSSRGGRTANFLRVSISHSALTPRGAEGCWIMRRREHVRVASGFRVVWA